MNAIAVAEVVQRLLEEQPCTLAKAYETWSLVCRLTKPMSIPLHTMSYSSENGWSSPTSWQEKPWENLLNVPKDSMITIGPYFIVGLLDDLVYMIKKSLRSKVKVVPHNKFKPYCLQTPLDNSWVLQDAATWISVEVLPPLPDLDFMASDIGPFNLWHTPSDAEDSAIAEVPQSLHPSPPATASSSQPSHSLAQSQRDEAVTQHPAGGQTGSPLELYTSSDTPEGPQTTRQVW